MFEPINLPFQNNIMYNPANWYWLINDTTIYSSASGTVVDANDPTYVAWSSTNPTTSISTFAELDDVLLNAGQPITGLTPLTTNQLIEYATNKADSIISTVKLYGTGSSTLKADRTASTIIDLFMIQQASLSSPTSQVTWVSSDQTISNLTTSNVVVAASALTVASDRRAIFAVLATAITNIKSGTITTKSGIDALSWPA